MKQPPPFSCVLLRENTSGSAGERDGFHCKQHKDAYSEKKSGSRLERYMFRKKRIAARLPL